jgi:hypothetical protein
VFRTSDELLGEITYKVLVHGPSAVGKSTFGASWVEPLFLDWEHRSAHLGAKYTFQAAIPKTYREGVLAIKELAAGNVPCKTIVADSLSKPYNALIELCSRKADGTRTQTDWPTVNRRMQGEIMDPIFAIPGKNIIAIAQQTTRLERDGREFKRAGVKFVGDEQRWPYAFDYILHFASRGAILVEKSMSPYLPEGTNLRGDLDAERFIRLVTGLEAIDAVKVIVSAPLPALRAAESGPAGNVLDQDLGHRAAPRTSDPAFFLDDLKDAEKRQVLACAAGMNVSDARLCELAYGIVGSSKIMAGADVALLCDAIRKDRAA